MTPKRAGAAVIETTDSLKIAKANVANVPDISKASGVDYIRLIGNELGKAGQLATSVPEHIGMFTVKTANRAISDAALQPDPEALYQTLWYEGEVCCLFSDSNLGKSILATQIAAQVAEKKKVLYFDFELSDKQFQLRYSDERGNPNVFPENLYRVEIDRDSLDVSNFEDALIDNIEQAALRTGTKVLVIDNLTYLCVASEKGDMAGALMLRLMNLKKRHDLSMLILAHTPKRCLSNPITQNDLAGSKKLYNFFDSVFAIGKSAKDGNLRYIKQLKVRYGDYTYGNDNVIVSAIEKVGTFLRFRDVGVAAEREHLREPSEKDREEMVGEIKRLSGEGKTQREIARILNLSLGCVNKHLRE